ncbi:MAG: OmpA family protein [Candidatus Kapaibacteriales bacterium]
MKEEPKAKKGGGAPDWMVTFSDLMTLLLTFFVLLLSMAEVDSPKFERAVSSLQSAFAGINLIGDPVSSFQPITMPNPSFKESYFNETGEQSPAERQTDEIFEILQSALSEQIAKGLLQLEKRNEKVMVRFPSDATFRSGSADLSPAAIEMISEVGSILSGFFVELKATGYTDTVPIKSARYRSNYGLSADRAVSVALVLQESGDFKPEELVVIGHGEGFPIESNSTAEGRAANRRVELEVSPELSGLQAEDFQAFGRLDSLEGIQSVSRPKKTAKSEEDEIREKVEEITGQKQ